MGDWGRRLALVVLTALVTVGPRVARAGDADARGRDVYAVRCAPCHGAEGGGDGPGAAMLNPKPRNFRDPGFWRGRTVTQLRLVVKEGRPGTLMAPFQGVLTDSEIDAVVAYLVDTFRPPGR